MKTREEILQRIIELQEEIYRLKEHENFGYTQDISRYLAEVSALEWVLNEKNNK